MTVTELLAKLTTLFPRAREWIVAWADTYRRVLGNREGADLRLAFERTLDGWAEPGCPKPAEIAANLPAAGAAAAGEASPALEGLQKLERQFSKRARELEATWVAELAEWFATAKREGWAGHLRVHVASLARWCAQRDGDTALMIAAYNARDYRGRNAPPRAADCLVDERDADIFRARVASHARFGRRQIRKESTWMAQRRAELNARIKEHAPA